MHRYDLSRPERATWTAFPRGTWVDLRSSDPKDDDPANAGNWGPKRIVRAEVITAMLQGARALERGRFPVVLPRGARITGRVDLMGAVISHALALEGCLLDQAPRFAEATTKAVRIVDSHLPGFNGARMRTKGILNFHAQPSTECSSTVLTSTARSPCAGPASRTARAKPSPSRA